MAAAAAAAAVPCRQQQQHIALSFSYPAPLFAPLLQPTVVGEGAAARRSALQTEGDGAATAAALQEPLNPAAAFVGQQFATAEEALEATGFLADRPAQQHGETGHGFYIVQPAQLLSLFPRAYLFPKFLDAERCQKVIDMASKRLAPSGGYGRVRAGVGWVRGSTQTCIQAGWPLLLPLLLNGHLVFGRVVASLLGPHTLTPTAFPCPAPPPPTPHPPTPHPPPPPPHTRTHNHATPRRPGPEGGRHRGEHPRRAHLLGNLHVSLR